MSVVYPILSPHIYPDAHKILFPAWTGTWEEKTTDICLVQKHQHREQARWTDLFWFSMWCCSWVWPDSIVSHSFCHIKLNKTKNRTLDSKYLPFSVVLPISGEAQRQDGGGDQAVRLPAAPHAGRQRLAGEPHLNRRADQRCH